MSDLDSASPHSQAKRATLLGLGAVALWGLLAALTALAGPIPPFQLAAMTFAIGTAVGVAYARARGIPLGLHKVPLRAWALGIYGLLAFHVAYFYAVQTAPVMDVSLVVYLWPLLIVVFSGLLPAHLGGSRLTAWSIAGAFMAFFGVGLLIAGGANRPDVPLAYSGLAAAFFAAFVWSSYSVASRLFQAVPSSAVTGFCAATALGSLVLHVATERFVWPAHGMAWLAILGCGLGPVGLAFYLWDEGMKHGDIRLLGVASYATPLISTLVLALLGLGTATQFIWIAALLITGGALLASRKRP